MKTFLSRFILLPTIATLCGFGAFAQPAKQTKSVTTGGGAEKPRTDIPERPEKLKFPPLKYEPPRPADYRVQLKNGPVAYVVPDRELPLVNINIYVRTGEYLEPQGKDGVAEMTGYLLARGGTKSFAAEDLEEKVAFLAAQLNSSVGETQGSVGLNLLSKDMDEGLRILREVLTEPRFQDDKITLAKTQSLQQMKQRNDDSADIESRERGFLAFGENFWANRYTTAPSLESITKADLQEFHRKWFHPSNFIVAANGDFDREQMVKKLEELFANWPFQGSKPAPVPTNTTFAAPGVYIVDKDVPQGRVSIVLPGLKRDDPDYFPALIMNDIVGGGGFTSHIMNRVRSDEGLAYSAGSSMPGGVYYPLTFTAGFQSKNRTVPYAVSIVLEELEKMAAQAPDEDELKVSKASFIDRLPRTFATKSQVANTFAQEEFTGRYQQDPNFWKEYRSRMEAVDEKAVLRAAKRFLEGKKPVILIVGNKEEILKGHPNHKVALDSFGPIKELPLRDPMTMKPLN